MTKDVSADSKYLLQSVDNTLSVIQILALHPQTSLAELSKLTGFGKSSLFRMLYTLENHNFIKKTDEGKYFLSYKLASLGATVTEQLTLPKLIHPFLEHLSSLTGESCHLVVLVDDTNIQFIDKVTGASSIAMQSIIGMVIPAHLTGTGKVLLAYSDSDFIKNYIQKTVFTSTTPYSIQNGSQLMEHLEKIRENGYGCDNEEHEIGLVCYAAPITDFNGNVIAAISVSGPKERMIFNKEKNLNNLLSIAKEISESIQ